MKFYHVDLCRKEIINLFKPRIPSHTLDDENTDIPRICVSSSIEGALGSVPWGGRNMCNKGEYMIFRVYEFDSSKIDLNSVITPKELVKNGYVPDALCYDEHWIMTPIKPDKVYYIIIESFYEKSEDYFTSDFYDLISNEINSDDFDYDDYYLGCCTVISDLIYSIVPNEDILTGNIFEIDLKDFIGIETSDLEKGIVWIIDDYISDDNKVKKIKINKSTVTIEFEEEEGLYLDLFKKNLLEMVS